MITNEQRLLPVALVLLPGLVCGLLGDVYLALRPLRPKAEDSHLILGGVVFFATGHLFYLAALLMMGEFSGWAILFSVLISILIYLSAGWMKLTWEKSKVPCMIYSFLIFLMIGQAFANASAAGFDSMTAIFFAGALLFGISDLILSQIYFKGQNDNKVFIIANLSTYYAAQVLIALALLYF